ncbi:MAG: hypothetical protein U1F65_04590 [Verrucomicrobiota bacterium]
MFKVRFVSRRRTRDSAAAREMRQRRFVALAVFIGLLLAVMFGVFLYTINKAGRI